MNKMNLYCIRCPQITDNSTNIELQYEIDGKNRLYSKCIDYGFQDNCSS